MPRVIVGDIDNRLGPRKVRRWNVAQDALDSGKIKPDDFRLEGQFGGWIIDQNKHLLPPSAPIQFGGPDQFEDLEREDTVPRRSKAKWERKGS